MFGPVEQIESGQDERGSQSAAQSSEDGGKQANVTVHGNSEWT